MFLSRVDARVSLQSRDEEGAEGPWPSDAAGNREATPRQHVEKVPDTERRQAQEEEKRKAREVIAHLEAEVERLRADEEARRIGERQAQHAWERERSARQRASEEEERAEREAQQERLYQDEEKRRLLEEERVLAARVDRACVLLVWQKWRKRNAITRLAHRKLRSMLHHVNYKKASNAWRAWKRTHARISLERRKRWQRFLERLAVVVKIRAR